MYYKKREAYYSMPFYLTRFVSGKHPRIELSLEEYKGICEAQRGVQGILAIEERFNFLLGNYADFERTMLEISLEYSIFAKHKYSILTDYYYEVNRRILNLLAAGRLYLDQVPNELNGFLGPNDDAQQVFQTARAAQYDRYTGFRVMEELRNYVQHHEFAAHTVTLESWVDKHTREHRIKNTVASYLQVSRLKEDKKFKRQVAEELARANKERIDLKPLIREYISGLGQVHEAVRSALESSQRQWLRIIDETLRRYHATGVESMVGLRVAEFDDDDYPVDSLDIFYDVLDRLPWLQERNRKPTYFQKLIVTSEVRSEA